VGNPDAEMPRGSTEKLFNALTMRDILVAVDSLETIRSSHLEFHN